MIVRPIVYYYLLSFKIVPLSLTVNCRTYRYGHCARSVIGFSRAFILSVVTYVMAQSNRK